VVVLFPVLVDVPSELALHGVGVCVGCVCGGLVLTRRDSFVVYIKSYRGETVSVVRCSVCFGGTTRLFKLSKNTEFRVACSV